MEQESIQHFNMPKIFSEPPWLAAILFRKDKSNIIFHTVVNILIDY